MTTDSGAANEKVRAEIARAFRELRPGMVADARKDADLDPKSRIADFDDAELEQFFNAYEALFTEALEGSGRETRELIFETALPPILDMGQTALDMIRSNAISGIMLAHRLLPLISPDLRDDAARWLAAFQSGYAYDLAERVLALEARRR